MTSYADFMARAYTMEIEAQERYQQFAEQLETHNNTEVAQVFRKLAEIEGKHAKHILSQMRWPAMLTGMSAKPCRSPVGCTIYGNPGRSSSLSFATVPA